MRKKSIYEEQTMYYFSGYSLPFNMELPIFLEIFTFYLI